MPMYTTSNGTVIEYIPRRTLKDEIDSFYVCDLDKYIEPYRKEFENKIVFIDFGNDVSVERFVKSAKAKKILVQKEYTENYYESKDYLNKIKEADIILAFPCLSIIDKLIKIFVESEKKFIVLGYVNLLVKENIFKYIVSNKLWTNNKLSTFIDQRAGRENKLLKDFGIWFTNIDYDSCHKQMEFTSKYSSEIYPKYDNYDAIEVSKIKDIPYDYTETMGVPITFFYKCNSEQFEIIGKTDFRNSVTINGKKIYIRIFIKWKSEAMQINKENING